jgi:H+/Cl- antiporter ClcA
VTLSELTQRLKHLDFRALGDFLQIRPGLQWLPYALGALVVGFTAVFYSTAFQRAITSAQAMADSNPLLFLVTAPMFFLVSAWLVARFAPSAGGLGVPTVIAALESADASAASNAMRPKVALIVILSSIMAILGGSALGREGPMVLIAACLFSAVGHAFRRVWPEHDSRSWIVAGGAAGLAAAFQTPLAGVVFVLEELAQKHYREFKTYVMSAIVVAGLIAQWLYGRYLFLGYAKVDSVPPSTVGWAIVVAVGCGSLVFAFFLARRRLGRALRSRLGDNYFVRAAAIGGAVGLLAVVEPRTIGGGIGTVESLLFGNEHPPLLVPFVTRFFSTVLSHLSGVAGGFLAPALSLGAMFGSAVSRAFGVGHHNLLVLCGMAAFLGAMNRAPFTALVVVMEMTDGHAAIFPLMLSAVVGNATLSLLLKDAARRNAPLERGYGRRAPVEPCPDSAAPGLIVSNDRTTAEPTREPDGESPRALEPHFEESLEGLKPFDEQGEERTQPVIDPYARKRDTGEGAKGEGTDG